WTGYTDVSAGTLVMGSSGSIPSGKNLKVDGVLDLKGQNYTTNTFNGVGRVTSSILGDATLSVSNSGIFSGLLEDGIGRLSIVKYSSNILSLTGANTYSGLTTVRGSGRLLISNSSALGATVSGTVVESSSSLQLTGDISVGDEYLTLSGVGYSSQGALYNVSGSNTWSGTIDLDTSDTYIEVDSGSDLSLLGASSIVSSNNRNLFLFTRGDMRIAGVIANGSGYLSKRDDGTLSLEGNNTYTGATSITNGIVKISHDNALGDVSGATTVSSGASLALEGGIAVGVEPITITGSGHDSDTGALTSLSGDNSYGGLITLSSNASIHTSSDTLTLDGSAAISASSGRYLTVTGAGDLIVEGSVSIPNNGRIVLDSGTHLKMGASDVLSSTIDLEFNGGSFYTQGYNNELDQLILTEDSDLVLGTGSHTLRFTEAGAFNFRKLRIKDWSGTYGGSGASGSAGKVYVTAGMDREKLDQISFYNSGDGKDYYALQLESQEVVSGDDRLGTATGYSNVRISDAATVNGVWSGDGSSG
ncbi:autotransporter-associated beta strand repeat-containing protein, partial [Flavobacteriaceae bacterium LSUCC0859]|nr:autotransporter-associated beta strand repeat-containing protein [Flavobacteriaceae bacterium LSUCC0859]